MADGFLGRWAKRKNDALQGKPLDEPAPARTFAAPVTAPAKGDISAFASDAAAPDALIQAGPPVSSTQEPAVEPPAPLTLDDVQGLTKDSDFKPFMNKAVEPDVRNAAMKKLFADPHFNVMDRMDVYVDDYSQPDPIPAAMLRQMASAKFLKLFDDEVTDEAAQASDAPVLPTSSSTPVTAAHPPSDDNPQPPPGTLAEADSHQDNHAHSDLRLQPDHAAESPDPGRSAA